MRSESWSLDPPLLGKQLYKKFKSTTSSSWSRNSTSLFWPYLLWRNLFKFFKSLTDTSRPKSPVRIVYSWLIFGVMFLKVTLKFIFVNICSMSGTVLASFLSENEKGFKFGLYWVIFYAFGGFAGLWVSPAASGW